MQNRIRIYFNEGPPITKTFFAALGQVAQASAGLEAALRDLLAHLMHSDAGYVIGAGESMVNLLSLCERVAAFDHDLSQDQIHVLEELVKAIKPLQTSRNAVIHAQWYSTDTPRHFYGSRSRRPYGTKAAALDEDLYMTVDHLLELAETLKQAADLTKALTDEVDNTGGLSAGVLSRKVMKDMSERRAKLAHALRPPAPEENPPRG